MTEQNRFSGMMGGLKTGDEPAKVEPETKTKPAAKSKAKPAKQIPKSKDPDYVQIGLYLPEKLHRRVKAGAAITGLEMSDLAAEALELWLKKNAPNI